MANEILGRWLRPEAQSARVTTFAQALEVHLAVGEAQALSANLDLLAPEAATLVGPVAARLMAEPPAYDRLRLPKRAPHDVHQLEGALQRVIGVDTSAPVGSEEAALKEARLHHLLQVVQAMGDHIRSHGASRG